MKCINCGNKDTVKVFEEEIRCEDCGAEYVVDHYVCEECNLIWKAIDNEFVEGMILPGINLYEEVAELLDLDEDETIASGEDQSMNALMHRCLQCNTIAYEKKENLWHCPECSFEWETIGND